jgi:hypothetical protein
MKAALDPTAVTASTTTRPSTISTRRPDTRVPTMAQAVSST